MISLTPKDLQRLQWAILVFLLLSVAGALSVHFALKAQRSATREFQQAQQSRQDAHHRATRARDEEQELRAKIATYQALVAQGVIGQEHRLDWIDSIREIKKARKLLDVRYEIGPQASLNRDIVADSPTGFDIMASPMKLDMLLLHENDLLGFLADLRPQVKGYVRLNQCKVSRLSAASSAPSPSTPSPTAQLQASCELDWITFREQR